MTSLPSAKPEPLDVTCIEQRLDVLSLRSRMRSASGATVGSTPSSLLVILHYLLKNNIEDFNTRCCKNQLSGPSGFLPMFVGGSRANGRISA